MNFSYIWNEMSYNRYDYNNKNRLIVEEYNEKLDLEFRNKYEIDVNIEWEE